MENNTSNNKKLKNALCYVPIVAIILQFIEQNKDEDLERHIRYGIILFVAYIILMILISFFFKGIIVLAYMWISIYLWYKAYIWEDVKISFIDDFFKSKK